MRKPIALISMLLAVALIAACGGEEGGSSPLDNSLGYLPADTPFAAAISTDTESDQFENAGDAFEGTGAGEGIGPLLRGLLENRTGDLEEFEEALGNPFVVGATDPESFVQDSEDSDAKFVGAIQASSEDSLDRLVERQEAQEDGEVSGATIYTDDSGDPFAIEGDVLIVAGTRAELEAALERRDGENRMTEDDFEAGIGDLPEDALARIYLDVQTLLQASDDTEDALKVKWVSALRTAGIALAFDDEQLAVDFELLTDSEELTEGDLPIVSGAESPEVLDRGGQIMVSLRDPSQIVDFARSAAGSVDPDGSDSFDAALAQIENQTDVDLEQDVFGQLEGDLAVAIDLDGTFGARGELQDPAAFERTLGDLSEVLPDFARGAAGERVGFAEPEQGEDFYAIATASGTNIVFGVVDGSFVISNDPGVAGQLAAAGTEAVADAEGALVTQADATELLRTALSQAEGQGLDFEQLIGPDATDMLGQLTGSVEASTESTSGSFTLTLPSGGEGGDTGGEDADIGGEDTDTSGEDTDTGGEGEAGEDSGDDAGNGGNGGDADGREDSGNGAGSGGADAGRNGGNADGREGGGN